MCACVYICVCAVEVQLVGPSARALPTLAVSCVVGAGLVLLNKAWPQCNLKAEASLRHDGRGVMTENRMMGLEDGIN